MHWHNSNFQIAYFIAGKCHTADQAYKMLCELREERMMALHANSTTALRRQAQLTKRRSMFCKIAPWIGLEIDAQMQESKMNEGFRPALRAQCEQEIAFINKCIAIVGPLRKYSHLPDPEAHQACQREEWMLELMDRAENFMLSGGVIPADQLDTMRAHPDWSTQIYPYIRKITDMARANDLAFVNGKPQFVKVFEQALLENKAGEVPGLDGTI